VALNAAPALMRGRACPGSLTSFFAARISLMASMRLAVLASRSGHVSKGQGGNDKKNDDDDNSQGFNLNMIASFFNADFSWVKGRLVWWEPAARTTDWISS
jgi:hypothetical protein